MVWAFEWVIENSGLTTEKNYPYTSGNGTTGQCNTTKEKQKVAQFSSYQIFPSNITILEASLAKFGPISIAVCATQQWQVYKSGVLSKGCDQLQKNHGVLLVGYGTDDTAGDYWKIRNSWGVTFGEQGYIRLKRGIMPGIGCNAILTQASTSLTSAYKTGFCLADCDQKESCCFGDCCSNDVPTHCCKHTGCCPKANICCGEEGGYQCCPDSQSCCDSQCCSDDTSKCVENTCCKKNNICKSSINEVCCVDKGKCCPDQQGKQYCATQDEVCCPGGGGCSNESYCCGNTCCEKEQQCVNGKCTCKKENICGSGENQQCCDFEKTTCCTGPNMTFCMPVEPFPIFQCCASGDFCLKTGQECCGATCCQTVNEQCVDGKCVCKKENVCGTFDPKCCPVDTICCNDKGHGSCQPADYICCLNGGGCNAKVGEHCCWEECCIKDQQCQGGKCIGLSLREFIIEKI